MPIATSSRRNTLPTKGRSSRNRSPSSDRIEEGSDNEPEVGNDDVDNNSDNEDEDEDQPVPPSRVKKEKISRRLRAAADSADEEQGNEDNEDRIDVANFKDQPLARSDAGNFTGIITDWQMVRKQSQSAANGLMENIGVSMADLMDEDESTKVRDKRLILLLHFCFFFAKLLYLKSLAELDVIMKDILDVEEEMILHEATVNELYQQLCQGNPIVSLVPLLIPHLPLLTLVNRTGGRGRPI